MSEVKRVSVNRPLQHGDVAKVYDMDDDEAFVAVLNTRDGVVSLSDPRDWGVRKAAFPLGGRFQVLALFELDGKPYRIEPGMGVQWIDSALTVRRVDCDGVPLTLRGDGDETIYANSIGVVNNMREGSRLDLLGFRHPVKAIPLTKPGRYRRDDGQVVFLREWGLFFEEFNPSRPDEAPRYTYSHDGCAHGPGDVVMMRIVERLGDLPKVAPPDAKVYVRAGKTGNDCRVEVETPDGSRYVLPVIRGTILMDYNEPTTVEMTLYVEGTEAPDAET